MGLADSSERDAQGGRIWRGARAQAIFNLFISVALLPGSYYFCRWMILSFQTEVTPPFVQGLAATFGYFAMGVFILGALYGAAAAIAAIFDRRPMLRIDDTGIAVRTYFHPRDFFEPRLARWSEIEDIILERPKDRNARVLWTIFVYLKRERRSLVWQINAPNLGVRSKPLFALLAAEWRAHGGRRHTENA